MPQVNSEIIGLEIATLLDEAVGQITNAYALFRAAITYTSTGEILITTKTGQQFIVTVEEKEEA